MPTSHSFTWSRFSFEVYIFTFAKIIVLRLYAKHVATFSLSAALLKRKAEVSALFS